MKIVLLALYFPPKWLSGSEIAAYNVARSLAAKGYEISVVTTRDDDLPPYSKDNSFSVYRLSNSKSGILGAIIYIFGAIWHLIKIDPDIVQAQGIWIQNCILLLFAKIFLKKFTIAWGQGSDIYSPWIFKKMLLKLVFKYSDIVIALTEDMLNEMNKFYLRKILIIPIGVDLDRFKNLSRSRDKIKLNIGNDSIIALFVGRLHPIKGVRYLIEAIALLKEKLNIKLIIIGDGQERIYLENLASVRGLQKNIYFLGKRSMDEIPQFMKISDIFILPSLSEGFPLTIIEAMASGLPIITTKVRGLPEIVIHRENGLLVDSKSANDLADKILEIINDGELYENIANNNINKSLSYSWEAITNKLVTIYSNIKS